MQNSNKKIESHTSHLTPHTSQKGITLIALIITIIVMLILVGVTVNVALNGGLFQKAEQAKTGTQLAIDSEELQIAVVSALNDDREIPNAAAIKNNLQEGWEVTGNDGGPYTCTSPKENVFTVDKKGNITEGTSGEEIINFEEIKQDVISNPETYLAKAAEAGQDIEALTDIAIGTDGNVVNLGSWTYTILDETTVELTGASGESGYTGDIVDGRIVGSVPQYIYSEGKIYTVTKLNATFSGLTGLKYAPGLPTTVTQTYDLFKWCEDLEEAPKLHEGLVIASSMFEGCTSLSEVDLSILPGTLTKSIFMFYECSSLVTAPVIPASVNDMEGMFAGCTSLTGTITINTEDAGYSRMLEYVGSEEKPIILKGTGNNLELLEKIKATGNLEYITIE